ncbi:hypothetical protein [Bradyrhizobium sp. RDM4]|uniref:phage pre-tape measure protein n=1 Tax=Bradyrhizobium sp. RDM4 TaxID=3378765 RepID=UPI0038FCC75F
MTDIVNFVPLSGSVTVRGTTFKVRGLEFEELGQLIYRFPQVLEAWKGGKLNMPSLVSAPALIAAAIACAIDKAGDAPAEKSFANLALGERAAFLSKILELTAPDGIGPFVDLLRAAAPAPQQLLQPENPAAGKNRIRVRRSSRPPTT